MGIRAIVNDRTDNQAPQDRRARAPGLALTSSLSIALLLCLAATANAEWRFAPRVVTEATYTDNIRLDPPASAQEATVLHLAPGFALDGGTQRFKATVDYELGGYFYTNLTDSNQTVNTLDATATAELLPELAYLDLLGRAGRTVVDPAEPIATGDYYTGANFTDVAMWRATPRIVHDFGGDVKALLSYDYGTIYYLEDLAGGVQLPNLMTREAKFSLEHAATPGSIGWSTKFTRQEAQYEGLESAVFSDAEGTLELPLDQRFWVVAVAGGESDVSKSITAGKLDSFYWEGGFHWIVTSNQQLRLTMGRRYFGNAYSADYSLKGRRLKAELNYAEAPAAQGIELYVNQIFVGKHEQPLPAFTPQGQEIYLHKAASGWATLVGARNDFTLQLLDDRRNYTATLGDERTQRATLAWRYHLGPRTEVHAGAGWTRLDYRDQDRTDDLTNVGIGVTRRLGRLLEITADYRYWKRDVNDQPIVGPVAVGYTEDTFTLGLRYGR
jgi:hypothetical protein